MRIEWIHPSWRDLVIDELSADADGRRAFLRAAQSEGLLLALSVGGGADGRRVLPLLQTDDDWDLLTDRLTAALRIADAHLAGRLLAALAEALATVRGYRRVELGALSQRALDVTRRSWNGAHAVLPLATLEAWLQVARGLKDHDPPPITATWSALEPTNPFSDPQGAADWLELALLLDAWHPEHLARLGFPHRYLGELRDLRAGARAAPATGVWLQIADRLHRLDLGFDDPHPRPTESETGTQRPNEPHRRRARRDAGVPDVVTRILRDL